MGLYAGIDLGGSAIKFGICSADGSILYIDRIDARVDDGPERLMQRLMDCARKLLKVAEKLGDRPEYIGLGTPGSVEPDTGEVVGICPNIPGWLGVNPKSSLQSELGLEVLVENDANAMTIAEWKCGAGIGHSHILAATVGTGIGGGIVSNGQLVRGKYGAAGELGHTQIVPDGKVCNCGRTGCLEQYAASGHLIEMALVNSDECPILGAVLRDNGALDVSSVIDAWRQGSRAADRAIRRSIEYLAQGISSAMTLLDPEIVIVGGGTAEAAGDEFVRILSDAIILKAVSPGASRLRVVPAALGNRAGVVGASLLGIIE
jgi:glucokinase